MLAVKGAEEPNGQSGVRALIVAKKLSNGSGAKGRRKVET
jgi:hypothetical protein